MKKNGKKTFLFFKKLGMLGIWDEKKKRIPVTALQLIKTTLIDTNGEVSRVFIEHGSYVANPQKGIIKSIEHLNNEKIKGSIKTIQLMDSSLQPGAVIKFEDQVNSLYVDVCGVTKGKGFQGVMKRHNFSGGRASHGNSISHRSHGATGSGRSGPQKVFKGKKMAGHMGHDNITVLHLKVMKYMPEENILLVKGSVPGPRDSMVSVRNSIKKGVTNE